MGDCTYNIGDEPIVGREAIIDSYRRNGQWAGETFDHIDYESRIEMDEDGRVCITFIDDLHHAGQRHEYKCRQLVRVNKWGLIELIEHTEITGQRDELEAFLSRVGVKRPE